MFRLLKSASLTYRYPRPEVIGNLMSFKARTWFYFMKRSLIIFGFSSQGLEPVNAQQGISYLWKLVELRGKTLERATVSTVGHPIPQQSQQHVNANR
jgi:hypothetical protein